MKKPTPNPPETEDTTPYEFPGSKKLHDAAERALDHYLKPNALTLRFHKPSSMFQVAPDQDYESLLVHACESLAQASLMTSDIAAYESPDSKKFHEAAERALDHYLKPNALALRFHKPSSMFQVAPDQDNESLLVHACESLAQASLMTSDIAAYVDLPQRRTILAIQQIIMLAELAVNRVLDNVDIPQPAPHS